MIQREPAGSRPTEHIGERERDRGSRSRAERTAGGDDEVGRGQVRERWRRRHEPPERRPCCGESAVPHRRRRGRPTVLDGARSGGHGDGSGRTGWWTGHHLVHVLVLEDPGTRPAVGTRATRMETGRGSSGSVGGGSQAAIRNPLSRPIETTSIRRSRTAASDAAERTIEVGASSAEARRRSRKPRSGSSPGTRPLHLPAAGAKSRSAAVLRLVGGARVVIDTARPSGPPTCSRPARPPDQCPIREPAAQGVHEIAEGSATTALRAVRRIGGPGKRSWIVHVSRP